MAYNSFTNSMGLSSVV